jgi:hypothetical protein
VRTEYTDLDQVRAATELRDAVLVGLDLGEEDLRVPVDGALFLGCTLSPLAQRRAAAAGALVFPTIPGLPYDVYRSRLYTPAELFAGFDPDDPLSYADTPDALIYRHSRARGHNPDPLHALAERLHDHAITEALADALPERPVGIPTWFYGHEPPNPACELHAKYFANSVREEGLLTVATGGIIYTPGSAGTVQEVFQDYCQNHYGSVGPAAPTEP